MDVPAAETAEVPLEEPAPELLDAATAVACPDPDELPEPEASALLVPVAVEEPREEPGAEKIDEAVPVALATPDELPTGAANAAPMPETDPPPFAEGPLAFSDRQ